MLIQLTIENFLSFRDEVTFSMVGVSSDRQHADRLMEDAAGKGRPVLPIAAIYGANAAGKSNLIEALIFVQDLILEGTRSSQSIPVSTFKLGNYSKAPSKFEFIFTHQDARYSYGFKLNREQILEEWLHVIPPGKKKEVMYFERITSSEKKTSVNYGSRLTGRSKRRKQFLEFIAEGTRPNQLLLTEATERNVETLFPIVNWFAKVLNIIPAESIFANLDVFVVRKSFTDFLSEFLMIAGTGIEKVDKITIDLDFDRHFSRLPMAERESLIEKISELDENFAIVADDNSGKKYILVRSEDGSIKLVVLVTQHRHENGKLIDFAIDEESEGTQRLINLIPSLFLLQGDDEHVIFIDELDRRLHPLLSRLFIKKAIDCRGKENQLIFTTHDTNLLDLELLRRDEIWFVEKDRQGSSSIYSLAEFKTRPDLKIEKGYLNGRFGAIPFFGNPESLGWNSQDRDAEMETIEN
ncbi:ATP/GTP-binding protein [Chamaesiphon sp. OTE_20_metabat_361]|uniref:AAA family ATPase n=1 Tax=Chamaesiphon sp. OTE_20_metabat_361 TaxID=2964689 RepID=UPI00286BFC79|nr:ATP/GTP-binding protein [Chamaesiphon sp. OTE_20_metabat_361]